MIITIDKDGFLMLDQLAPLIDISSIVYYSIKKNKDKTLTLRFYNKQRRLIKPNEQIKKSLKRARTVKARIKNSKSDH